MHDADTAAEIGLAGNQGSTQITAAAETCVPCTTVTVSADATIGAAPAGMVQAVNVSRTGEPTLRHWPSAMLLPQVS